MSASPTASELARDLHSLLADGLLQRPRRAERLVALAILTRQGLQRIGLSLLPGASGPFALDRMPDSEDDGDSPGWQRVRNVLEGCQVESVRAAGERALVLRLRRSDGERALVVDLDGPRPGLAVVEGGASHDLRGPVPAEADRAADAVRETEESAPADADTRAATAAFEAWSAQLVARRSYLLAQAMLTSLVSEVRAAVKRARRLVEAREGDAARLGEPELRRREADALAAHLHEVRRGDTELRLDDWVGEGAVAVPLDARLAPAENLRRAYHRAARAERARDETLRRLENARDHERALEAQRARADALVRAAPEESVDAGDWSREVATLAEEARPLLGRRRTQATTTRSHARRTHRRFTSLDGFTILVGRSAAGNDELVRRVASGNDPWFHARDCPGPHVLLRLPKGAEIPQESLLDAATLAHALSKRGDAPGGAVTWCRAKHLRRPKGAPPGQVLVTQERTVDVVVEPARLERLRASEGSNE